MTIEAAAPVATYQIQGVGPYALPWPYGAGGVTAMAELAGVLTDLVAGVDFTLTPVSSDTSGDLTLSVGAAATYALGTLHVSRQTAIEQGWAAVMGAREAGLEAQLDQLAMRIQELDGMVARALRARTATRDFVAVADHVLAFDDQLNPIVGPTVDEIEGAEGHATAAAASAAAALASAAAAAAAENSLLEWQSAWVTATAYSPSDIVKENGDTYICLVAHTSGVFATDHGANKWEIFVPKGAAGAGTGDVLAANNGTEFTAGTFRANLALCGALSTAETGQDALARVVANPRGMFFVAGAGMSNIPAGGAANDIFFGKGLDANNVTAVWIKADGSILVNCRAAGTWGGWIQQATKAYVDAAITAVKAVLHVRDEKPTGTSGGTFTAGSLLTRTLNTVRTNTIAGASLAANRFTLPAGTYEIDASAPAFAVNGHAAALYNVTDAAVALWGTAEASSNPYASTTRSKVKGFFTIAASKQFEIRHRCSSSWATAGFGAANGFAGQEVYTDVLIRKVA